MNAAAELRHVRRDDYIPMVRAFMPTCEGEELEARSALLLMRDMAMSTKRVASEYGWSILDIVQNLAAEHALRAMKLEDLKEIRRQATRLVGCASGLDVIFAPKLPLPEGDD